MHANNITSQGRTRAITKLVAPNAASLPVALIKIQVVAWEGSTEKRGTWQIERISQDVSENASERYWTNIEIEVYHRIDQQKERGDSGQWGGNLMDSTS